MRRWLFGFSSCFTYVRLSTTSNCGMRRAERKHRPTVTTYVFISFISCYKLRLL